MIGKQHLVLAVPGWKLSPYHASCRERLMMLCLQRGLDLSIMPETASGIDLARNITVAKFLSDEFVENGTVLGMIDGDLIFDPEDVFTIVDALEQGLEVVGGMYPKKKIDYAAVGAAAKAGVPDEELKYHAGEPVGLGASDLGSRRTWTNSAGKRFRDADRLGTGFLFMARKAIEKFQAYHGWRTLHRSMWEPRGPAHTVFFSEPQGPRQRARDAMCKTAMRFDRRMASTDEMVKACYQYASAQKAEELDVYQTEDFNFVYRAKEAGIGCWTYVDANLAHQGTWVFEGNLAKMIDAGNQRKAAE